MAIDQKELGRRLKLARKSSALTQGDVARHLGVSRSTVAQIEAGNRMVTGIELSCLAYLFCKDIRGFVAENPSSGEDILVALFRVHPELSNQLDVLEALRRCVALGREMAGLELLVDVNRICGTVAYYPVQAPQNKWEAVQQGEHIAFEERKRLDLGLAPLPDIADLLVTQGILTAQIALPDDISGLTIIEPEIGFFVVVNSNHNTFRMRFSYAHEYCHVLLNRNQGGRVSQGRDRDELAEIRANSFAANFLIPTDAVRRFIYESGKGKMSRSDVRVFDERSAVRAQSRSTASSQEIQIYDLVQMAFYFGVSRTAACYRLKNMQMLTDTQMETLLDQDKAGYGKDMERVLGLAQNNCCEVRSNVFRHRFLGLAFEALRRGAISRAKLIEIAAMVDVSAKEVDQVVSVLGLDGSEDVKVNLPGE